jgi:hypothetical protein
MSLRSIRQIRLESFAAACLLAGAAFVPTLSAQERRAPAASPPASAAAAVEQPRAPRGQRMDAPATRQALMEVLEKHPPSVGRVLKLDASLMQNESFLAAYPELRDFLREHPEVPQNAGFFLEPVRYYGENWQPQSRQHQLLDSFLSTVAGFAAAAVVLGTLVWLIRTTLDQRRWNRLSKIQAEVHTKLMDRFSSNDELMTYVQTPSGRRFLESGPSPLQEVAPTIAAPLSKILWSVQLGAVLLVSGIGFLFLSGRAVEDLREFFYVAGCLTTAIGTGFGVSAAAAYYLSRRLGLLDRPAQHNA